MCPGCIITKRVIVVSDGVTMAKLEQLQTTHRYVHTQHTKKLQYKKERNQDHTYIWAAIYTKEVPHLFW